MRKLQNHSNLTEPSKKKLKKYLHKKCKYKRRMKAIL